MEYNRNTAKFIRSLKDKKARDESGLFVVEGEKMVQEALRSGWAVEAIFSTKEMPDLKGHRAQASRTNATKALRSGDSTIAAAGVSREDNSSSAAAGLAISPVRSDDKMPDVQIVTTAEMERMSLLNSPSPCLALVHKANAPKDFSEMIRWHPLALALDGVRDPGNLGTILRLADWFGIDAVFVSDGSGRYPACDIFNPKTVQATMGAIFRRKVFAAPLPTLADAFIQEGMQVYGTFLDGENIYGQSLEAKGLIVMGNESEGVSPEMGAKVTRRLFIPPFPAGSVTSESLNVATATAITLSEFRR